VSRAYLATLLAAVAALASACSAAEQGSEAGDEDELAHRTYLYVDANAEVPLRAPAREKIQQALAKLDRVARRGETPLRRALAAETLARVEAGDVLLGSMAGARGIDRWHMCKDYALPACKGAPPSPDDRTWRGDDEVERTLDRELAGYMWGNRLYFTLHTSTDPIELAATLVHEINHVSNRSECSYYRNIDTHEVEPDLAFVEEYRAFLSECYFTHDTTASPEVCSAAAFPSTTSYGFAADLGRVLPGGSKDPVLLARLIAGSEDGGDARFGHLVPRKPTWPASFGACAAR
jgi:hypothetical protein